MLRLKILVSVVPLIVAAMLARIELLPSPRPCIALGSETLEIASAPWHADLHVSFTGDPRLATVRVAMTDNAEAADFAVVDDAGDDDDSACEATPATQFIASSTRRSAVAPGSSFRVMTVPADYRIFVRSKRFSAREAAALIVGAHGQRPHLADAAL